MPDCNGSPNALNYTQSTDLFSCLSIATLSNPMTGVGDMIDGGAAGASTRLAGPTSGNSPYILTSLPSGGIATAPVWSVVGVPVDSQGGATFTIQSDAQTTPDRNKVVNLTNNTTSTAVTLPQAGSAGMLNNFPFVIMNSGSVIATITPTTSTINGDTAIKLLGTVSGHTPSAAFIWSDAVGTTGNYWAAQFLPTDANGRLGCEGFMALTGDVTNTAGACATTVGAINGTAFTGTNGHLVSFGAANTPADSGVVAANVVTAAGTLTSTALMTGAGTKTSQTPSTTSTLDGSGNLAVAAGGSLGSADTGTPKFTFATNKATFNQQLVLGTASNQLVTGTTTNLTTLTFPASSGAATLTFPNTTELMVGANSDTTTTHILHATAVAGVGAFSALACGDLPALTGDTTTTAGSCATTTAKINSTSVTGTNGNVTSYGAGNTLADAGFLATNVVRKDTTNSAAAAMTLDLSAATGTAALIVPTHATNTATTAGVIDYDSTNSNYHGNSGADSIFGIVPTASVPTTGNLIDASVVSSKFLLHDSGVATANVATAASNFTNAGLVYAAGANKTLTNSADFAIGGTGNHSLLGGASGMVSLAGNGAASASAFNLTGTVFTGGTVTTTLPLAYFNQGASGPTTWSTSGTELGINAVAAYAGDFEHYFVNGTSIWSLSAAGNVAMAGNLTVSGMTGGPFCVHETAGVLSATASDCGAGGGGASAALTILSKTANYTTVAADFSASTTAPTEVIYSCTTANTTCTHTLPSATTSLTSGGFEIVKSSCSSTQGLLVQPATLTLDGSATVPIYLEPCSQVTVTFDGSNFRSSLGQSNISNIGGVFFPVNMQGNGAGGIVVSNINIPEIYVFELNSPTTMTNITVNVATAVAASHCDVGIYDVGGNLIKHTGSFSCATATQVKTTLSPAVTLSPGTYTQAWCTDTATVALSGEQAASALSNIAIASGAKFGIGQGGATAGTPSAVCTAGVLPATVALTINGNPSGVPYVAVTP